jgi:cupin superfamily protein
VTRLLEIDPQQFNEHFARDPFTVRHNLTDHPLLSVESLAKLADRIPAAGVEHNRGDVPEVLASGEAPKVDLTPGEIARGIETNGCWMVLKHIEQDPEYKALLDETLDEVVPLVSDREGGMHRREGFVFLSAPNSVTPSHIDPEHNFLLQIRGVKEMNIGRFPDRAWALRELDRYHDGGHRNLDQIPPLSSRNVMHPGQGVYVYPFAPHWVNNGPEPSVSLSITFRTDKSERDEAVHVLNARLRKRGLHPRPLGDAPAIDRAKAGFYGAASWLHRLGRPKRGARDYS